MAEKKSPKTEVLLGEKHVRLADGRQVVVRPWGVRTGRRVMSRIQSSLMTFMAVYGGNLNVGELIDSSYDEVVSIVADTIGMDHDKVYSDDFLLEDLVAVIEAIVEVNFTDRPGGGGLGKRLTGLFGKLETLTGGPEEKKTKTPATPKPTPPPSSS